MPRAVALGMHDPTETGVRRRSAGVSSPADRAAAAEGHPLRLLGQPRGVVRLVVYSPSPPTSPPISPQRRPATSLLGTMTTFAVGFFARPVGAWLMGIYATGRDADGAHGRRGHDVPGLADHRHPGLRTIGIAAPIILVLARILQGLSVGGEYGPAPPISPRWPGPSAWLLAEFQFVTMGWPVIALGILALMQTTWGRHPERLGLAHPFSSARLCRGVF